MGSGRPDALDVFREAAVRAVDEYLAPFGFALAPDQSPYALRFVSGRVTIQFAIEHWCEFDCYLTLDPSAGSGERIEVALGDVVAACGMSPMDCPDPGFASGAEQVNRLLCRHAAFLAEQAAPLLMGSEPDFREVARLAADRSGEAACRAHAARTREETDRAWAERDYQAVVDLIAQLDRPTRYDSARSAYAAKMMARQA